MLTDPIVQVAVHLTPRTHLAVTDEMDGTRRVAVLRLGHVNIHVSMEGDAGIIATTGQVIAQLEILRRAARERIAAEYVPLPDGLDDATLAEATEGWAPGEITEAWGS